MGKNRAIIRNSYNILNQIHHTGTKFHTGKKASKIDAMFNVIKQRGKNSCLSLYSSCRRLIGSGMISVLLLFGESLELSLHSILRFLVAKLDYLFDSAPKQTTIQPHVQRYSSSKVQYEDNQLQFINEKLTLQQPVWNMQYGSFNELHLITETKKILDADFGVKDNSMLADDFQFIFQVMGPLPKEEFLSTFPKFGVNKAFPNMAKNYFGFTIDPLEPNRVWFFSRAVAKHEGPFSWFGQTWEGTGIQINCPPQVFSFSFDDRMKCYKFTGGYPVDRHVGNTGGLGGLFGFVHALGGVLPFSEGRPTINSFGFDAFIFYIPNVVENASALVHSVGRYVDYLKYRVYKGFSQAKAKTIE